jgi:hypothetical protein
MISLTDASRLGTNVTSNEGKNLCEKFWGELLQVLKKQNPQAEEVLSG